MDLGLITAIAGGVTAVGAISYAAFVEPYNIRVVDLKLSFHNLPEAFDGYTILHLSDFHSRKLGRLERRLMRLLSRREVDTCFVTGDVTHEPRASDVFRRICSVVRHKDPLFMVLGNSEHKPWVDTATLVDALSFDGLTMLINENTEIRRRGQRICLVGVDDPYTQRSCIERAFEGVDRGAFTILLCHCPSVAPDGIRLGADLVLAGHTHGGQVRIPGVRWFWTHMRRNKSLNDGLYLPERLKRLAGIDAGGSALFVNRGIGTSRLYVRFCCPPEIAYITLSR